LVRAEEWWKDIEQVTEEQRDDPDPMRFTT
jgi:hypothetical protein